MRLLADTSVWVDHLRSANSEMIRRLTQGEIIAHPFVIGELCLGSLPQRALILHELDNLPKAEVANDGEVRALIDRHRLWGRGVGFVDAHLIASVALTAGSRLWTRGRRLQAAAEIVGVTA